MSLKREGTPTHSQSTVDAQYTDKTSDTVAVSSVNSLPIDHPVSPSAALEAVNGVVAGDSGKEKALIEISTLNPRPSVEATIYECFVGTPIQCSMAGMNTVVAATEPSEELLAVQPLCSDQPEGEDLTASQKVNAQIKVDLSNGILHSGMNNIEQGSVKEDSEAHADTAINNAMLQDENPCEIPVAHVSDKDIREAVTMCLQATELPELDSQVDGSKTWEVETEGASRVVQSTGQQLMETKVMEIQIIEEPADTSVEEIPSQEIEMENGSDDLDAEILATDVPSKLELLPGMHEGSSQGRTRSGTRFSDDTNMLKEFLNRAQARKAAISNQEQVLPNEPASPRRSPRKILAQLENNFQIPTKSSDQLQQIGPSPVKQKLETIDFDEVDELASEPTSCRRSARTRVAATVKLPAGTPSLIPVRRGDGMDPVVLHKSVTHELTILTRTNTKRNKGQSKAPKFRLPDLVGDELENVDVTKHLKRGAKRVSWDDQLVHYVGEAEEKEGKKERRPRIRRLRGLGAANGTPAAKKVMMDVNISGPRRPGKTKG